MNNLDLLHLAEFCEDDAYEQEDFETNATDAKTAYTDFYDDIKQPSKYLKEDW